MKNSFLFFVLTIVFYSGYAQGVPAEKLFNCYWQDSANNCASIAMIKANLNAFGLNGIFTRNKINNKSTEYLLKDGTKITITQEELAKVRSKFNADTTRCSSPECADILHISFECYAIMAKTFPREFKWFKSISYDDALNYISDTSFDIRYGTNLLGTGAYFYKPRFWYTSIVGKKGVIVWSSGHTVFASGNKCDMRGRYANFSKGSLSYTRFHGRMWIDPTIDVNKVQ